MAGSWANHFPSLSLDFPLVRDRNACILLGSLKSHTHALIFLCGGREGALRRLRGSGARIPRSCWAPFRSLDCLLFGLTQSCSADAPRGADLGARNGADWRGDLRVCIGFCGCLGEATQLGLKTETCLPPGLAGCALPEASPSFWGSQASLGLWSHPSNLCLHCYVASSCVCLCPGLLEGHTFGFWAISIIQDDLTSRSLTHYTCKDPDFK